MAIRAGNPLEGVRESNGLEVKTTPGQSIVVGTGLGYRAFGISGGPGEYVTDQDITANTTTTTAPRGSTIRCYGTTLGFFQSDGAKWQFIVNA